MRGSVTGPRGAGFSSSSSSPPCAACCWPRRPAAESRCRWPAARRPACSSDPAGRTLRLIRGVAGLPVLLAPRDTLGRVVQVFVVVAVDLLGQHRTHAGDGRAADARAQQRERERPAREPSRQPAEPVVYHALRHASLLVPSVSAPFTASSCVGTTNQSPPGQEGLPLSRRRSFYVARRVWRPCLPAASSARASMLTTLEHDPT